jgi:hypothetical protein
MSNFGGAEYLEGPATPTQVYLSSHFKTFRQPSTFRPAVELAAPNGLDRSSSAAGCAGQQGTARGVAGSR